MVMKIQRGKTYPVLIVMEVEFCILKICVYMSKEPIFCAYESLCKPCLKPKIRFFEKMLDNIGINQSY